MLGFMFKVVIEEDSVHLLFKNKDFVLGYQNMSPSGHT